ncbi:NAD(P)/FAD-dependent oxidoreductase [Metamycoplasma neophronis]|uniref:FAD-binding protein n=1 Tax=Metamycoplasma neophronis TaxID=872983 RepID=A0ABY2Z1P3_9BACT|nr:FAD-dependent oxidoreductase [Metamycoplasma neophronis]TPR53690.1 FAD-binding protein [Metamycoplasma neophronis]
MSNKYDVIIIGAGPAGLTAALYLSRNDMNVAFIEGYVPGGKMAEQSKIENYPGFSFISGIELSTKMLEQARQNGANFIYGMVEKIESIEDNLKKVVLADKSEHFAQVVIIATGMKNLVPTSIEGIEQFKGRGVSYCVLCDGALYKNEPCAIIGGGNSAFEEAPYLASMASEVHIFVRDGIIAEKRLVNDVKKYNNIIIHENSEILKLFGTEKVEKVEARVGDEIKEFKISAVFPYIGFKPATNFIENKELLDARGFIKVDENMETMEKNIFAVGDVIVKDVRQITTATSDGTIAAKVINSRIIKD